MPMPSNKPRIQIRFEEEDFSYLEEWAKSEFIPVTQLCRAIILRTVAVRKSTKTMEVTKQIEDELDTSTLLQLFASGKRPTDGELLVVSNEAGIDIKQLWEMRDRLFPQKKNSPQ